MGSMKRIFFLVCALLLLLDLTDDGYIGKAKYVAPHGQGKYSFSSSSQNPVKIDLQSVISPTKLLGRPHCCKDLLKLIEVFSGFTINGCYLLGSSGGIPL
jgi:hypothetical protein